jgi:hypothetical protein
MHSEGAEPPNLAAFLQQRKSRSCEIPLRKLEEMASLLAIQEVRDLADQRLREIATRVELQWHLATGPYSSDSQVPQILEPLLDSRLFRSIHLNRVSTHQLSQQKGYEFVHATELAAEFLFCCKAEIFGKPNYSRFAHG